jgi:hypothetical protein
MFIFLTMRKGRESSPNASNTVALKSSQLINYKKSFKKIETDRNKRGWNGHRSWLSWPQELVELATGSG